MIQRMRPLGVSNKGVGRLGTTDIVQVLSDTITKVEGSYPPGSTVGGVYYPNGSLAYQNNNPGNSIYIGPNQQGQTGVTRGAGGFAKFATPESGRAALEWQVQNYIDRGYDINAFVNSYAPANTTNGAGAVQTNAASAAYKNTLASALGIPVSGTPIKLLQTVEVASDATGDTTPVEGDTTTSDGTDSGSTTSVAMSIDPFFSDLSGDGTFTSALANADPMMLSILGIGAIAGLYLFFGPK